MTNLFAMTENSDGLRMLLDDIAGPNFLTKTESRTFDWRKANALGSYGNLNETNLLRSTRFICFQLQDGIGLDASESMLHWLDLKIGGHRLSCSTLLVPLMCDSNRQIKARAENLLHKYNPLSISEKVFLKETRKEMLRLIAEDRKALDDV